MTDQIYTDILICDIDDSLIKCDGMGPLCVREDGSFDFEMYADHFPEQETIEPILNLLLEVPDTTYIVILTSRSDIIRDQTEYDLKDRGVPYNELVMLPDGITKLMNESNYKEYQTAFKKGVLDNLMEGDLKVKLVVDDLVPFNVYCSEQGISVINPNSFL